MNEQNAKVLFMNKPKRFTLEEARALLPDIRAITQAAFEETAPTIEELKRSDLTTEERIDFERELQVMANAWAGKITRLGAVVKGLWLVDFDSGNGFYCWTYDEPTLDYFHSYDQGFSGRTPIQ